MPEPTVQNHRIMAKNNQSLHTLAQSSPLPFAWQGAETAIHFDADQILSVLLEESSPVYVVKHDSRVGIANQGQLSPISGENNLIGWAPPLKYTELGDRGFRNTYGVGANLYAGSMANGISSETLVIAMGKAGFLASFGAGGCPPARIEKAIAAIQEALPDGPYAFNLLNSPADPALEARAVELYLTHRITALEASAYIRLTAPLVRYRAAGLSRLPDGSARIGNRVIAKISRREVAAQFLSPAPDEILNALHEQGEITSDQAAMARTLPMADDITVEADSGGHTDNRPMVGLIPSLLTLRDELQQKYQFDTPVRIGAAGGIATPHAALAAFMMGAAFVATGSINQACVEAGASEHTRNLLAQAGMADIAMSPASDMFEMGVKVQVLRRGTMFAQRASRLYDLYSRYDTWEDIPLTERQKLETTVFRRSYADIWSDTARFLAERDPRQVERAGKDARHQMALVFRWYLGLSSRWANSGEKGREMDYQIWCGPAMGSFNEWARGSCLAEPANRRVVDISRHLLRGAAYLARVRMLTLQGVGFSRQLETYRPAETLLG